MWVMPSSSARCAQLPRAADKVPYYAALKKFRDYLNGTISHLDESDIVFADSKLKKKEQEAIEDKKPIFADDLPDGESRITEINGMGIKQESGMIPGKKKRGRPKKIKNPEDQPPPDPEKLDANGEVIKKRRGRPKKIHQQQKQLERENREREQQQQQQQHQAMGHLNDYGNVSNCFSPPLMSPPKAFPHMAPYPQPPMNDGFFGQGMNDNSPYNMSAKQSPVHLQHYSQSPKSMSLSFTHSDLSSEINTAISSENNLEPSPLTSPSVEHPDFEPPTSMSQQNMGNDHRQYNPAGGPDPTGHHGSPGTPSHNSYANYMSYHEQTPDAHNPHPHQTTPTPLSQTAEEHSHHSHPTPPHHPHTPTHTSMSPHHPHEQYGIKRNSGQDVASKSLSDLESLVDQIPSIADGGSQRLQHSHPGMPGDDSLAEKMDAHHQSYMSGFGGMPAGPTGMTNYSPPLPPGGGIYPSSLHHSPTDAGYGGIYGMNGRHHQDSQQQQQQQQQHQQQQQQQQQQQHSKSYTVENLASSNYTPSMNHSHPGNSYPNIIPGHYPVPMGSTNGYLFGGIDAASSLMQRTYGIGGMSSMGGMHPSAALGHPITANPYPYNGSYSSSFDAYPAPPTGIHAPSANYPGYVGTAGAAPSTTTTPPSYLAPSHHRPPVDLSYDGV
ncbi:probable serine/threonine-protein kinase yakA [Pogonomyrmex barbatus]|uniref:Probable serine/threonine-protein kinase yakA n=1 Tax=Pogonomyrmex barbatus TaxID=144034 RepID=A0A8N1S7Z9_9HYME|nr:probable serine/threonine-protein kinase yakA [Pogonomyrmex barbatus]